MPSPPTRRQREIIRHLRAGWTLEITGLEEITGPAYCLCEPHADEGRGVRERTVRTMQRLGWLDHALRPVAAAGEGRLDVG